MIKRLRNKVITIHKNTKRIKKNIRKMNPPIFSFNISSAFIYEPKLYDSLLPNNIIKPNGNKVNVLKSHNQELSLPSNQSNRVYIMENIKYILINVKRNITTKDKIAELIEK